MNPVASDKFKTDLDNLFFKTASNLIRKEINLYSNFILSIINSTIDLYQVSTYKLGNNLYRGFSLKEWSKIIHTCDDVTFKLRTCSKNKIICNTSSGIALSLNISDGRGFEILLKSQKDKGYSFFIESGGVLLKPVIMFSPFNLSFLAFLNTNEGLLVFMGFKEGPGFEILLSIFLKVPDSFFFLKERKSLPVSVVDTKCQKIDAKSEEEDDDDNRDTLTVNDNSITLSEVDLISVEVGLNLLTMIDPSLNPPPIFKILANYREAFLKFFGFPLPGVRFKDNLLLKPSEYVIKIKENIVSTGEAIKDRLLVLGLEYDLSSFEGPSYGPDAVYGLKGKWIEKIYREIAERYACLIMEPVEVIICHIQTIFSNNLDSFIGIQITEALLDDFMVICPNKVLAIRKNLSLAKICRIFKHLVSEWIPLTNPEFILTSIYIISCEEKNPTSIYEKLRKNLIPLIFSAYETNLDIISCFTVSYVVEEMLIKFSRKTEAGYSLNIPFSIKEKLFKAALQLLYRYGIKQKAFLFCSSQVRPLLLLALRESFPDLRIFSYDEIPSGFSIHFHGEFTI